MQACHKHVKGYRAAFLFQVKPLLNATQVLLKMSKWHELAWFILANRLLPSSPSILLRSRSIPWLCCPVFRVPWSVSWHRAMFRHEKSQLGEGEPEGDISILHYEGSIKGFLSQGQLGRRGKALTLTATVFHQRPYFQCHYQSSMKVFRYNYV